jgi:hypothetical protein
VPVPVPFVSLLEPFMSACLRLGSGRLLDLHGVKLGQD